MAGCRRCYAGSAVNIRKWNSSYKSAWTDRLKVETRRDRNSSTSLIGAGNVDLLTEIDRDREDLPAFPATDLALHEPNQSPAESPLQYSGLNRRATDK